MKETNNKTVLIAMTGGIESTVAAYLLKKQGYKCIGIGLQLFLDGEETGPFCDVAVLDLNKIKNICNYLDIPFYAVNAVDIFAYHVLDPLVGRVLSGHTFEPLVFLNRVLLEVMIEKSKKFQTNLIATAHYAKVLKNQKTGSFELMVANDLENDQSYSLAGLSQKHLENLILPLSEIRKKEVEKISELIKVEFIPRIKSKYKHIMHDPRMIDLVEARSSTDLRRLGSIYDYASDNSLCEHLGIHRYYVGQSNLVFDKKTELQIDPLKEIISIVPFKGNIFIDFPKKLKYQNVLIGQFQASANLDMSLSLSCFVKISPKGEKVSCRLYFKNNKQVLVAFDEVHQGLLIPGQFLVFYTRQGIKGKVIGAGLVEVAGVFDEYGYNTLPPKTEELDEENENETNKKDKQIERLGF